MEFHLWLSRNPETVAEPNNRIPINTWGCGSMRVAPAKPRVNIIFVP